MGRALKDKCADDAMLVARLAAMGSHHEIRYPPACLASSIPDAINRDVARTLGTALIRPRGWCLGAPVERAKYMLSMPWLLLVAAIDSLEVAMSLELLNTVASLATVAIVSATAIAAVIQLRHLRVSNQISAVLSIGERFRSTAYVDAYQLLGSKLESVLEDASFRAYEIAHARNLPLPDIDPAQLEVRRATVLIGNMYEELGLLVKNGTIDRRLFVYQYALHIIEQWNRLKRYIAFVREAGGSNMVWEMFEYLVVL